MCSHINVLCFLKAASQWFQVLREYTPAVFPTVSDVIVNFLMFVWQLLITPLVFWGTSPSALQSTATSMCQSLSAGDSFPDVRLSVRIWLDSVFTCGPSPVFRLIPYKPEWPFSLIFPWLLQLSETSPRMGCWPCIDNAATRFKQKPKSFYFSFFFLKVGSIYCAGEVAPTKARICKLLFYTICLWKNFK